MPIRESIGGGDTVGGDPVMSKDEAKKELVSLKEYLDLGIINQEEFDNKAVAYKKILLGN